MDDSRPRKHRTTEEARQALSNFCKAVGTHGDKHVHIFSIPVDNDRDVDCIISDVIEERDLLMKALEDILSYPRFQVDPPGAKDPVFFLTDWKKRLAAALDLIKAAKANATTPF